MTELKQKIKITKGIDELTQAIRTQALNEVLEIVEELRDSYRKSQLTL